MKSKIRIVCLHQGAEMYGSDRSFLSVVQALVQLSYVHVTVVLPIDGPLVEELNAIGVIPNIVSGGVLRKKLLKTKPLFFLKSTFVASWKLRKIMAKSDIVYVNTIVYFSAYLAGMFLPARIYRWAHVREIPSRLMCRLFLLFFRIGKYQRIYNSFQTRLAFKDENGVVVYNGVPCPKSISFVNGERDELKLLLLGRINTWKGHEFLLEAIDVYYPFSKNIELTIVGDVFQGYEELLVKLKMLASHIPVKIIFEPFTSDPSVFFKKCDLVIVPSILPEPFGRIAIEAFSYGKSVIAANHGGLSEIVTHDKTGYLFEPNSPESFVKCLNKYLEMSREERQIMSKNSRERYEELFSEDKYTNAIKQQLLENVCCNDE